MNATVGRNDPCPCRSGKKFKQCCHEARGSAVNPESPRIAPGLETWKIVVGGLVLIVLVGVALWIAGQPRAGQIVAGVSTLVLVIWSAFRTPPPRRAKPGDSVGINFGR